MTYFVRGLTICLLYCVGLINSALAQFTFPEYDNIYVNDFAHLLDAETEQRLKAYTREAEANGTQVTVLTIDRLSRYGAGPEIEAFSTALFNHWGVGDAGKNNGILVLVSHADRKMRIEIGQGYSASWDKKMKRIIDDVFIPYFKNEDYQSGIEHGVIETIKTATGKYPKAESGLFSRVSRLLAHWWNQLGLWLLAIAAPILSVIAAGLRYLWRMRPRSCDRCGTKMAKLDETSDDEHIDGGQRLEEYLKSVDYDVWQCQNCAHIDIYRYVSFFSSYKTCPQCRYKTLSVDTTVIVPATTSSTGLKRLDYECERCDFVDTETRTIPMESSSSTGSSSGFGGGSSSGGGASGSW